MGKNKNRGERTGQQHRDRHPDTHTDDTAKSTNSVAQDTVIPVSGAEQHVSHKRGKKFGHN